MILNTTDKPFVAFSAMQRLATNGEVVTSQYIKTIEEFDTFYGRYANVVTKVIIDDADFVLANDICNSVDCPVVTLDIESIVDKGTWEFREYSPDETI